MARKLPPNTTRKKSVESLDRESAIRVRYVPKSVLLQLKKIAAMLNTRTLPDTILKMIDRFEGDQSFIAQVQARNTQLHKELARYVDREEQQQDLIRQFIQQTAKYNKMITGESSRILKLFSGAKRSRAPRPAAGPGRKNAPHTKRKGGANGNK